MTIAVTSLQYAIYVMVVLCSFIGKVQSESASQSNHVKSCHFIVNSCCCVVKPCQYAVKSCHSVLQSCHGIVQSCHSILHSCHVILQSCHGYRQFWCRFRCCRLRSCSVTTLSYCRTYARHNIRYLSQTICKTQQQVSIADYM